MNRLVLTATAAAVLAVPIVAGCARSSEGTAVPATGAVAQSTTPGPTAPASTPATTPTAPESSVPGVVETTAQPVPAGAVVCPTPRTPSAAEAVVADPAAPRITVALPDGWSAVPGAGDVGARLTGPAGMTAEITITATAQPAAAAFTRYADDAMARYPISTLSVLPAVSCGFSGQELMGTWADNPDESISYRDRIVHVRTNTKDYLVAVHVQAPSGTPGFEDAASVLTGEPGIVIP